MGFLLRVNVLFGRYPHLSFLVVAKFLSSLINRIGENWACMQGTFSSAQLHATKKVPRLHEDSLICLASAVFFMPFLVAMVTVVNRYQKKAICAPQHKPF
jgi:hypothetical protein